MKYYSILIFMLMVSACSTKPFVVNTADIQVSSAREIYILSHGWHSGFVIPAATLGRLLPKIKERFGNAQFIEIGWGDKGFYQAQEITSGLTIQAIFWPTESVVHVVAVPVSVEKYFPGSQIETVCLQSRQFSKLLHFIENSFLKDSNGNIIPLRSGIYGDSQFYKGEGEYYLFNTCNKWTAKGLKSAEMDISTTFKLTASSIMDYLTERKGQPLEDTGACSAGLQDSEN